MAKNASKTEADTVTGDLIPVGTEIDRQAPAVSDGRQGDTGIGRFLVTEREEVADDSTDAYRQIISQILNAETVEDVLTDTEAVSLQTLHGQVIEIDRFDIRESEYEQGSPVYLTIHGRDVTTGEPFIANCGNQRVLAQLGRLGQIHESNLAAGREPVFPVRVLVKRSPRPNKFGSFPLKLIAAKA